MKGLLVWMVSLMFSAGLGADAGSRFSIDLYLGAELNQLSDLNQFSRYNEALFGYYHGYYSAWESPYSRVIPLVQSGEFKALKRLWMTGGRLRWALSSGRKGFSLSLGLRCWQGEELSSASLAYELDDYYQGSYQINRSTSPQRLWMKAYAPLFGVHVPLVRGKRIALELMCSAGPAWATCSAFKAQLYQKREEGGYQTASETVRQIEGNGIGLALEPGIRLEYSPLVGVGLFLEGGGLGLIMGELSGEGYYLINTRDNNEDGYSQRSGWRGAWVMVEESLGRYPEVDRPGLSGVSGAFSLDSISFYLRLGLHLGF